MITVDMYIYIADSTQTDRRGERRALSVFRFGAAAGSGGGLGML